MNTDEHRYAERENGGWGVFRILWVLALLLLLYIGSTGPVLKVCYRFHTNDSVATTIYAPLIIVCKHCSLIERFLDWYVKDLWRAYK